MSSARAARLSQNVPAAPSSAPRPGSTDPITGAPILAWELGARLVDRGYVVWFECDACYRRQVDGELRGDRYVSTRGGLPYTAADLPYLEPDEVCDSCGCRLRPGPAEATV